MDRAYKEVAMDAHSFVDSAQEQKYGIGPLLTILSVDHPHNSHQKASSKDPKGMILSRRRVMIFGLLIAATSIRALDDKTKDPGCIIGFSSDAPCLYEIDYPPNIEGYEDFKLSNTSCHHTSPLNAYAQPSTPSGWQSLAFFSCDEAFKGRNFTLWSEKNCQGTMVEVWYKGKDWQCEHLKKDVVIRSMRLKPQ